MIPGGISPEAAIKAPKGIAGTRADEATPNSLDFSYAYEPYTASILTDKSGKILPAGTIVYEAFEFTRDLTKRFAGKTVTSVNVWSGTTVNPTTGDNLNKNMIREVTVFLADDLDKEPFYTQTGSLTSAAFDFNSISLDTPYTIEEGKTFVVGYYFKAVSSGSYYLTVDGIPSESAVGGYCGYRLAGADNIVWGNCASTYGNICMGCTIEGEGLPVDGAKMFDISVPEYVQPGVAAPYEVYFAGDAANKVSSVELEFTIGTSAPSRRTLTVKEPIGYNQITGFRLSDIVCNDEGIAVPFEFKITKVNGVENTSADNAMSGTLQCFPKEKGYTKVHTFEEGTGTWCGWCPAGIVMLDYIKEKYADTSALIALHGSDEMQVNSCIPVLNMFSGFPTILVDRVNSVPPTVNGANTSTKNIKDYVDNMMTALNSIPSPAAITTLEAVSDKTQVSVKCGTTFAFSTPNDNRFRLSFYITEDGVGPYDQKNYFSGSKASLSGWEKEGESVSTVYNDVARLLEGDVQGISNSLPASIEAATEYAHTVTLSTRGVAGATFNLIAMINDAVSGSIVNARSIKVVKDPAGIDAVAADSTVKARGGEGVITISGEYGRADVWTLAGSKAASATSGDIDVPSGLYIVNVDGQVTKVLVK